MAKGEPELEDMVATAALSAIERTVKQTYKSALDIVKPAYNKVKRQRDAYAQKAQAYDIAVKYLRNGTTTVSEADKKKVGPKYASQLTTIVNVNKKLKEAKGLKGEVSKLKKQRDALESDLESQKKRYDAQLARLEKKYAKSEFIVKQLEALYELDMKDYEAVIKDAKAEKQFVESHCYYEGKPVPALTKPVIKNLGIVRTKRNVDEWSVGFLADMTAVVSDKPPEPPSGKKKPGKK